MKYLQGIVDIGKRTVLLTIEAHIVELPLEPDWSRDKQNNGSTDREDFTSYPYKIPSLSSEDEPEERFKGAEVQLIIIQRDFSDSDLEQMEKGPFDGESATNSIERDVSQLLAYQEPTVRKLLDSLLVESGTVVISLDELCRAKFVVKHSFLLANHNSIYTRSRPLPLKHNNVVREELKKILEVEIITASSPDR